jgi:hypothetical protein
MPVYLYKSDTLREFGYSYSSYTFVRISFSALFLSVGYCSLLADALFLSCYICRSWEIFYTAVLDHS